MHSVNGRRPGASPSPADTEADHTDADDAALLPATLGNLADLADSLAPALPCWCPDAPGRHLRNCHIEAVAKLARQWTCTGSAGKPGWYMADCDCPQCRFEWTMGNYTAAINNLAEAIREGDTNMDMNITGKEGAPSAEDAVADDLDLKERIRRVIKALERNDAEQGEDGKWTCAHPDHPDEHPSMSVLWDNETGKISFKCWSCGPPDGTPEKRRWTKACLDELGLPWSVLFNNHKVGPDHESPF